MTDLGRLAGKWQRASGEKECQFAVFAFSSRVDLNLEEMGKGLHISGKPLQWLGMPLDVEPITRALLQRIATGLRL